MTATAASQFLALIENLNLEFKQSPLSTVLTSFGETGTDFSSLMKRIINLSRETAEELNRADFANEDRRADMLARVEDVERQLINAIAKRGGVNSTGTLVADVTIEKLRGVAEQIEEKEVKGIPTSSREEMMAATESLIAEVKNWEMEPYPKRILLLQLTSIQKVIQQSDLYSSSDLRLRVKAVVADFLVEFDQHDKAYRSWWESLRVWARRTMFAGTTTLGLTADASSVVALLPKP